jgi:hypothetical protein
MRGKRGIQHGGAGHPLPYPFLHDQPGFHGGDGDVAEGMVQKVTCDIEEERQAGDKPQLTKPKPVYPDPGR